MKNKHIISLIATALTTSTLFSACEDEPDKYEIADGVPELSYVRTPSNADSLITSAYTNTMIVLVGNNLRAVKELYFNDQKATLNTSYMTDHTILVTVPKSLPETPTDSLYMINKDGVSTAYPFGVDIPAPTLSSMTCEYVKPGDVATINGDYFLSYDSDPLTVTMPDGKVITDFKSLTQYTISFVVPEGCTEAGAITVTSKYGSTESTTFNFNDDRGLLFDFDGVTGLSNHGWHNQVIETDETAISGNFLRLGGTDVTLSAEGGWDDSHFSFEYWPGNWQDPETYSDPAGIRLTDLVEFTDYANMAYKFELYVPSTNQWNAGALQVLPAGVDVVSYGNANVTDIDGNKLGGCNNTYISGTVCPRGLYRPWEESGTFDTNDQWITVTMPIANFIYDGNGSQATGKLSAKSFTSLVLFVCNGGITGTECKPVIKIDNVRAVPYK